MFCFLPRSRASKLGSVQRAAPVPDALLRPSARALLCCFVLLPPGGAAPWDWAGLGMPEGVISSRVRRGAGRTKASGFVKPMAAARLSHAKLPAARANAPGPRHLPCTDTAVLSLANVLSSAGAFSPRWPQWLRRSPGSVLGCFGVPLVPPAPGAPAPALLRASWSPAAHCCKHRVSGFVKLVGAAFNELLYSPGARMCL